MAKLVCFKFKQGNFEQGFEVMLRIGGEAEIEGSFPAAPNIPALYESWRSNYLRLRSCFRGGIKQARSVNTAELKYQCYQSTEEFRKSITVWLDSENRELYKLKKTLFKYLSAHEEIQVIIQTEDQLLRQLPWQEWDLFADHYPNAEIALGCLNYEKTRIVLPAFIKNKVRILAILGNSEGINIESDRQFLENLPNAESVFLPEPKRQELSDSLWEQNWDILFFAGHSSSQFGSSKIDINPTESLVISDLKNGLKQAIKRGLKIAIFNSCDGLGLARELEDLSIPQVIVMREPVPDEFAQEFLKYFLSAFAGGQSLYLAVRYAKERLKDRGLDAQFPGVTWLPTICHNPAEGVPTWKNLIFGKLQQEESHKGTNLKEKEMTPVDYLMPRFRSPNGLDFLQSNRSDLENQLFKLVYEQFQEAKMESWITKVQSEPNDQNKLIFFSILETQIAADQSFANKLIALFKQFNSTEKINSDPPQKINIIDSRSGGNFFEGTVNISGGEIIGRNKVKRNK